MYEGHPKDHKKISYKLPIGGIISVFIIIVGFATMQEPEIEYNISVSEIQEQILLRNNAINPEEAGKILFSNNKEYRFIDLRNPQKYLQGHLEGAINIPSSNLFAEENQTLLKDTSFQNILYSSNHTEACGPWMILKQIGYNNNKVLLGGYEFMKDNIINNFSPKSKEYTDEVAKYDFAKIVKETAGSNISTSSVKKKKSPVRRKRKAGASGSCG